MSNAETISVGTAGWSIPAVAAHEFPSDGSGLTRYSSNLSVVEINSSFYRPHRISTWERWKVTTPAEFRFSVKVPKLITHQQKLVDCDKAIADFLAQAHTLKEKLKVLLVQLPPSLVFEPKVAAAFFATVTANTAAFVVCEPRHISWFTEAADYLLKAHKVSRVATDPALCEAASIPGGSLGFSYWRLHGSPSKYRSSYADRLPAYADLVRHSAVFGEAWCIFDNTASAAAVQDALALHRMLLALD